MANQNPTPQPVKIVAAEKKSRIRTYINKHPRMTRVAGVIVALLAVFGVAAAVKSRKQDDNSVASADVVEGQFPLTTETTKVEVA